MAHIEWHLLIERFGIFKNAYPTAFGYYFTGKEHDLSYLGVALQAWQKLVVSEEQIRVLNPNWAV
ncbi:MAG: hypothetical protein AAGH46_11980 [Bacteroidota bacterium]